MSFGRPRLVLVTMLLAGLTFGLTGCRRVRHGGKKKAATMLTGHAVQIDRATKIVPWGKPEDAFARVATSPMRAFVTKFPIQSNGLRTFFTHSRFDPKTFTGDTWPHNPAGLAAMMVEASLHQLAFRGDAEPLAMVRSMLIHHLEHGTTPADFAWAKVPYASSDAGSTEYRGADDGFCDHCGRGDGVGFLEPDKIGELGFGYLRFYQHAGEERFKQAAIDCADALAKHVSDGDETHSPWPFRVNAKTNEVRDGYTAHVVAPIQLFDELVRLNLGDTTAYKSAREKAWKWLFAYPMQNGGWTSYFEDIPIAKSPYANLNQYAPLQTARYLLENPSFDPDWRSHVNMLLAFVKKNFAIDANGELGFQFGAEVLSEQQEDMAKMGSHTARYGAIEALFAEKTGDSALLEPAYRSLSWATYMCDAEGIVVVGPDLREGWWFSDGYGDYVRHFFVAMAANPTWAPPAESHLLRTTSTVQSVSYVGGNIRYTTFDVSGDEVLRVAVRPKRVKAGVDLPELAAKTSAPGYTLSPLSGGGFALRIHRESREVEVVLQ